MHTWTNIRSYSLWSCFGELGQKRKIQTWTVCDILCPKSAEASGIEVVITCESLSWEFWNEDLKEVDDFISMRSEWSLVFMPNSVRNENNDVKVLDHQQLSFIRNVDVMCGWLNSLFKFCMRLNPEVGILWSIAQQHGMDAGEIREDGKHLLGNLVVQATGRKTEPWIKCGEPILRVTVTIV